MAKSVRKSSIISLLGGAACVALLTACNLTPVENAAAEMSDVAEPVQTALMTERDLTVTPDLWPEIKVPALDPVIEARIDDIMSKMTLEQKVGQVIQADSDSVTPEEVKQYRLGSVLSGGSSAPGDDAFAPMDAWIAAADAYWEASVDPEGVEIAIPIIWGIDAVHGHANLAGATIFPHNIGLGAANDPDLIEDIARITAEELIVSGHDWTFAPTIATPRDDRWGRTYEGYSERPEIVRAYAERIVYGLQGRPDTDGFLGNGRVISSAKHYVGDGGTLDGIDQGETQATEQQMIDIHAQGYFSALEAGVQTVMSSFSSWQGVKMHGSHAMLTEVLKDRMGFTGFIVGDWNGHGQVPGCTNTDCPQSLNAGLDMYMAPDSWKGLYESTLQHVKGGNIPMERLDDAVRRILRVKLAYGIFDKPAPSQRPGANDESLLATPEARNIARRAVRESLVLLKNNDNTLPLSTNQTVLVVGDGADSITKTAGGWTLSWQGGGYDNSYFPNGESILEGIEKALLPGGGTLIFDPTGEQEVDADVVIAVYGENPYAEGIGDIRTMDFVPNGFDTEILETYRDRDIPVVSVFLSGRPLWVNPEINDSDAFVAAWLPGSEGGGVADVLFRTDPEFDFTGRLSYSWPATAQPGLLNPSDAPYDPLFAYGYGLSYDGDTAFVGELSEDPGLSEDLKGNADPRTLFKRGRPGDRWSALLAFEGSYTTLPAGATELAGLSVSRTDYEIQEDALVMSWSEPSGALYIGSFANAVDLSDSGETGLDIVFAGKVPDGGEHELMISGACDQNGHCETAEVFNVSGAEWAEYRAPSACMGLTDLTNISIPAVIATVDAGTVAIADIRFEPSTGGSCSER
ncbi:glycoside hydrolase family 3 protein [Hyphomonas sp.]|uniref:glycoside hydrolase family 3 protein n=1 Tax=Hyphomonas sp. TaxID=87 RepID=UPI0025C35BEC|nr:glycoside hydrolase family 3 protein [Hyphomonas sp.]